MAGNTFLTAVNTLVMAGNTLVMAANTFVMAGSGCYLSARILEEPSWLNFEIEPGFDIHFTGVSYISDPNGLIFRA